MRVCQFRHFGTGIASGKSQIGSRFECRKCGGGCQIVQAIDGLKCGLDRRKRTNGVEHPGEVCYLLTYLKLNE